jgi:ABC-type antimicrobial peptide transport system permease subunit
VTGLVIAVAVSAVAALVTSAIPIWRAVNRPPIKSLSAS